MEKEKRKMDRQTVVDRHFLGRYSTLSRSNLQILGKAACHSFHPLLPSSPDLNSATVSHMLALAATWGL